MSQYQSIVIIFVCVIAVTMVGCICAGCFGGFKVFQFGRFYGKRIITGQSKITTDNNELRLVL